MAAGVIGKEEPEEECHSEHGEESLLETSTNQSSARSFHPGFDEPTVASFFTWA